MKTHKKTLYYSGIFLIVVSLSIFVFLYLPLFLSLILPAKVVSNATFLKFSIEIPQLELYAPIIENVNPFDENEYRQKLKQGVAHAKGSAFPEDGKTVYLFAHSSDFFWNVGKYSVLFLKIGGLQTGDTILLHRNNNTYVYKVYEKKIVWPQEVNYLTSSSSKELILQTCWPLGTSLQRLLVFAKQV